MSDYKTAGETLDARIARETKAIAAAVKNPGRKLLEARKSAKNLLTPDGGFFMLSIVAENCVCVFR